MWQNCQSKPFLIWPDKIEFRINYILLLMSKYDKLISACRNYFQIRTVYNCCTPIPFYFALEQVTKFRRWELQCMHSVSSYMRLSLGCTVLKGEEMIINRGRLKCLKENMAQGHFVCHKPCKDPTVIKLRPPWW